MPDSKCINDNADKILTCCSNNCSPTALKGCSSYCNYVHSFYSDSNKFNKESSANQQKNIEQRDIDEGEHNYSQIHLTSNPLYSEKNPTQKYHNFIKPVIIGVISGLICGILILFIIRYYRKN